MSSNRTSFDKLPDVPKLSIIDIEIRAITSFEDRKGVKIDLKGGKIKYPDGEIKEFRQTFLENLCVDYLRHEWYQEYNKICARKTLSDIEYLELNKQFADAIDIAYPSLGYAAQMQYQQKKRRVLQPSSNALDRILDDLLHNAGYPKKIRFWKWFGSPGPFNPNRVEPALELDIRVVNEIHRAPEAVCASSESSYVRGCKEWLMTRRTALQPLFKALS